MRASGGGGIGIRAPLPLRLLPLLALLLLLLLGSIPGSQARERPALQLLRANDERNKTGLAVVESTLAYIEALEHPVAVVSIVGPYHTGKSFLLNQVARSLPHAAASASPGGAAEEDASAAVAREEQAAEEVFVIGRGVDPETSGIWMWHREVTLPSSGATVDVLFLDTEGFSVSNVTEAYDAQVFAAATLLSSLLVYNSMHVLHANELEYLDLLVHNTQLFSVRTALAQQEAALHSSSKGLGRLAALFSSLGGGGSVGAAALTELFRLPPLLVTVQAFTMNLKGEDCGDWLARLIAAPVRSSVVHLQQQQQQGGEEAGVLVTEEMRKQQMGLGTLFPSVGCQTLFLPATSRQQLHNLAEVPLSDMTADFRRDLAALDEALLQQLEPKRWRGGRPLSGAAFAALVRLVVDALASGQLSDIPGRWELYEGHLRASSARAALAGFEGEVRRLSQAKAQDAVAAAADGSGGDGGGSGGSMPLTKGEMATVLAEAESYALALLKRLLVGLDRSYHRAAKEVTQGAADAGKAAAARNEAAVQGFLRVAGDAAVEADGEAVRRFVVGGGGTGEGLGGKGLPVASKGLEEWVAGREKGAVAAFRAATARFKDEGPSYAAELKAVTERVRAGSDALRLKNHKALEDFFEAQRAEALALYREELERRVRGTASSGSSTNNSNKGKDKGGGSKAPPDVHPPEALQAFHAEAAAHMTAAFEEGSRPFHAEKLHGLHATKLKAEAEEVLAEAKAANSRRVTAFCEAQAAELLAAVTSQVARLADVLDEEALEKGLAAAAATGSNDAFAARVGPALRGTAEGQAAERGLRERVAAVQTKARMALAEKIRRVLEEPLSDVCKRIIDAKCESGAYKSVSSFERDVERQCAHFVKKHEVGKKLSKAMLKNVLAQFISTDLAACRAAIAREERRTRFWRKVVGVGCGILALVAYVKFNDNGSGPVGNMLPRPQYRRQQQARQEPHARPPPFNPWAR